MFVDGLVWVHWCERTRKKFWWGNQGENMHKLMDEISNKNLKNINFSKQKVNMGSDEYI